MRALGTGAGTHSCGRLVMSPSLSLVPREEAVTSVVLSYPAVMQPCFHAPCPPEKHCRTAGEVYWRNFSFCQFLLRFWMMVRLIRGLS